MTEYSLLLTDGWGNAISEEDGSSILDRASRLVASRTANRIATFEIDLPPNVDREYIRDDNMVWVFRAPHGNRMQLFRPYFIRKREWRYQNGTEVLTISGPDCNDILRRRVLFDFTPTLDISGNLPCTNLMKQAVSNAFSDTVTPSPVYGTRVQDRLTVAPENGLGPFVEIDEEWSKLLKLDGTGMLTDVVKMAFAKGTAVYFDIVPRYDVNGAYFTFHTFIGQPGFEAVPSVTFSLALGNMENPQYVEDSLEEENYIYTIGQGKGDDQKVEEVFDPTLGKPSPQPDPATFAKPKGTPASLAKGPWARIEGVKDAGGKPDEAVFDAGRTYLTEKRPKATFYADPISTQDTTYGVDWDFGDRVMAVYHGRHECIIENVTITVENREERIETRLRSES